MHDKQETFTRAEVESLLAELQKENIQIVRDHFEKERAQKLPPVWLAVVVLGSLIGGLWLLAMFA